jgi:hypothetical protein
MQEQIYYSIPSHTKEAAGLADRYWDLSPTQKLFVSDLVDACAEQFKGHVLKDGEIDVDLLADSLDLIKDATEEIQKVREHIVNFQIKS